MNSLIPSLPWPRPARMCARLQPLAVTLAELALVPVDSSAASRESVAPEDDLHAGWLDSSLDLARGLEVTEFTGRWPEDLSIDELWAPPARA